MKSNNMDAIFYEQYLTEKKILSRSSVNVYVLTIRRFLASNPDIDNLEEYNKFLIAHSIKHRCYHYYTALKHFIEYKIGENNVKNALLDGMIKPKLASDIKRDRKHLNEDKLFEVINNLDVPKHRVIALIQSLTGVRIADVLRLKQGGIVPEEYQGKPVLKLNILGKGNKRNTIFIHDELAQKVIMNYITNNFGVKDYYFLDAGKKGKRIGDIDTEFKLIAMNYNRYWFDLRQALQTAGVSKEDFATHDFRRCFARRCWERYKDIYVLQSVLNHADPKVTLRYLRQSGLGNIDYHAEMQK